MSATSLPTFKNDRTIAREKLASDLRTALDDAAELLKLTTAQAGERIGDVRGRLDASLAKAREQLASAQAGLSSGTNSFLSEAGNCVREHPWKSLGAAGAAGALAGMLLALLLRQR